MKYSTSLDRATGHRTVEKSFKEMVYEGASLYSLLLKYGHQSNFWQRLDLEMCHKNLEIDHYLGILRHSVFKSHMERSEHTGKLFRVFE